MTEEELRNHMRLVRRELEELRQTSAMMRAIFEESPVGIAVYSPWQDGEDFVFVDLNPAGERLVGLSRDMVIGRYLSDLFPGVRAMGLLDALATAWRTGTPQRLSPRQYRDGRIQLWAENHITPLRTRHVMSIFFDVTGWIKCRQEERRGVVRFRRLYERLHEGFCFVGKDGRILEANPAMEALLGAAPGGLVGQRWEALVSPASQPVVAVLDALLRERGSAPLLELEFVGAAGLVPVHLTAYQEDEGWWAMVRNASEARRLRELVAWQQKTQQTYAALGIALLGEDDLETLGRKVVDAAVELTGSQYGFVGYLREDGTMVSAASSIAMADCQMQERPLVFAHLHGLWAEAICTGVPVRVDDVASHPLARGLPQGHVAITSFYAYPIRDGGQVVGEIAVANAPGGYGDERVEEVLERLATIYAVALRRTRAWEARVAMERQQAEVVFHKAQHLAKEAMGRLLPTAEIVLDLALRLEDQPLGVRQRGYVEGIVESARGLVRGLSQARFLFEDKNVLHDAVFDLRETLRQLVAGQRPLWAAKGLSLELHVEPEVPQWVRGDVGRLSYVLEQLLDNALAATESGGARLAVFALPEQAEGERVELRFCVEDSGVGIPEGQQANIATFFAQGYGEGGGMGLAAVRRIVEAVGGSFHLSSRLGSGTMVCLTFPLHRSAPLEDAPVILMVDDEAMQRQALRHLVASLGRFVVQEAASGAEALHLLAREPVHLVLIDMLLPDMSGLEVVRTLRQRERTLDLSPTPVWLITGLDADALPPLEDPELGLLVSGVLSKPLEPAVLGHVLQQSGLAVAQEWDEATALAQLGGNATLLAELRRMFVQESPHRLAEAEAALERGDVSSALRALHALKGNAATVGAMGVSAVARAAHEALRLGHVAEAIVLLPALRQALEQVLVLCRRSHES